MTIALFGLADLLAPAALFGVVVHRRLAVATSVIGLVGITLAPEAAVLLVEVRTRAASRLLRWHSNVYVAAARFVLLLASGAETAMRHCC